MPISPSFFTSTHSKTCGRPYHACGKKQPQEKRKIVSNSKIKNIILTLFSENYYIKTQTFQKFLEKMSQPFGFTIGVESDDEENLRSDDENELDESLLVELKKSTLFGKETYPGARDTSDFIIERSKKVQKKRFPHKFDDISVADFSAKYESLCKLISSKVTRMSTGDTLAEGYEFSTIFSNLEVIVQYFYSLEKKISKKVANMDQLIANFTSTSETFLKFPIFDLLLKYLLLVKEQEYLAEYVDILALYFELEKLPQLFNYEDNTNFIHQILSLDYINSYCPTVKSFSKHFRLLFLVSVTKESFSVKYDWNSCYQTMKAKATKNELWRLLERIRKMCSVIYDYNQMNLFPILLKEIEEFAIKYPDYLEDAKELIELIKLSMQKRKLIQ